MTRYLVAPGFVFSEVDGEEKYIAENALISLYGVKPEECAIVRPEEFRKYPDSYFKGLILLSPRGNGDYSLDRNREM